MKESYIKELKINAEIENLEVLIAFINTELERLGCPRNIQTQIDLAVEEIFVNIAQYAYYPETGEAVIRVIAGDNEMRIEFEDSGKPYNPLETAEPDINAPVEDRPIGGLGIFLVKKIMDSIEYRYEGNRNLLSLNRTISDGNTRRP